MRFGQLAIVADIVPGIGKEVFLLQLKKFLTDIQITVHLIGPRADDAHPKHRESGPTGLLDHIAFTCTGLAEMKATCDRLAAAKEAP